MNELKPIYQGWVQDVYFFVFYIPRKDHIELHCIAKSEKDFKARIELKTFQTFFFTNRWVKWQFGKVDITSQIFKGNILLDILPGRNNFGEYIGSVVYHIAIHPIQWINLLISKGFAITKIEIYEDKLPPKSIFDAITTKFDEVVKTPSQVITNTLFIFFIALIAFLVLKIFKRE